MYKIDLLMVPQMVLSPKPFSTDLAWVWSLVRVGPLVYQQVVRLGEVTSTEPTDVLLLDPMSERTIVLSVEATSY